jgi:hypothetical protein
MLRAVLLSDKETASFIEENFVPSWEMIREVPKVTIDFGNGKVLQRTLAGNTVLYVCTPEGQVVDALPGIYTPEDFKKIVEPSLGLASKQFSEVRSHHEKPASQTNPARLSGAKAMMESPLLRMLQTAGMRTTTNRPKADEKALLEEISKDSRKRFLYIAERMEDISKSPSTLAYVTKRLGGTEKLNREDLGAFAIKADSYNNTHEVRLVVHTWFAGLQNWVTPAEAKEDMFVRLLHIDYNDPYLGLDDVALPGTPGGKPATKPKGAP